MGRLLLRFLFSAHLVATMVVMGRPLREASAPGGAELLAPGAALAPSATGSAEGGEAGEGHRPFDKSIAGAEVMLGGLATAALAAVFCYIRVTRGSSRGAGAGQESKPGHLLGVFSLT